MSRGRKKFPFESLDGNSLLRRCEVSKCSLKCRNLFLSVTVETWDFPSLRVSCLKLSGSFRLNFRSFEGGVSQEACKFWFSAVGPERRVSILKNRLALMA